MGVKSAIRNKGAKVLKSARAFSQDYDSKKGAMEAARNIEQYSSQKLTQKIRKIADEYSDAVFGSKRYSPWLYVYTLIQGKFREGWIPDNFYGNVVLPAVNRDLTCLTRFKSFSNVVLRTQALPDIAYYIDGVFYDKEFSVANVDEARKKLSVSHKDVFVKKDNSGRGEGVIKLLVEDISEYNLQRIGNCVLQAAIRQHEFFDEIISGSVGTVRVMTAKDKSGRVAMRGAYLRLGRKDTQWVQSNNSVRVAIRNQTGELDTFGYTQDWKRWLKHPDTGVSFGKKLIPKFKETVELCIGLHEKVPHLSIIGWDVAVDDSERIQLMEWNANCDIIFAEATVGPCFAGLGWEKYKEQRVVSTKRL